MTATASRPAPLGGLAIGRADPLGTVLRLSGIAVVVTAHHDPLLMVATAVGCVAFLAVPRLLTSGPAWLVAAGALLAWQYAHWHALDNHVWLTAFWMVAVGCCLLTTEPDRSLAFDGRLFVGLIFGVATLWKVLSPDFLSGDFFEYSLLQDSRFATVAEHVGGLSAGAQDRIDAAVQELATGQVDSVPVEVPGDVERVAWAFTAWGVTVEGLIALTWLLPLPRAWRWLRHGSLLAFAATTYLIVPVGGFGCLLMVLGLTQVADEPRWRLPYLVGFVALLVYGPVWRATLGA